MNENTFKERLKLFFIKNQRSSKQLDSFLLSIIVILWVKFSSIEGNKKNYHQFCSKLKFYPVEESVLHNIQNKFRKYYLNLKTTSYLFCRIKYLVAWFYFCIMIKLTKLYESDIAMLIDKTLCLGKQRASKMLEEKSCRST